ncbi:MAG: immunity 22 family protein [Acidobacteria bacterium]|nr:immunity 22 family protein [Acidobacteriota bacterium]
MEKNFRDVVKSRLRHPGGLHEWLPVERADLIKKWGVAFEDYTALRTPVDEVEFTNPDGRHGGPGSARAHLELISLMASSRNLAAYRKSLNRWADHRLPGGRQALPEGLRAPAERGVSLSRAVPRLRGKSHVLVWLGANLPRPRLEAYLEETHPEDDDSLPLSPLAADFQLPWYDHDFLEARCVEGPLPLESLLLPFSFSPSFADLVVEEMEGRLPEANVAVLLYDSPYPPADSPPEGSPLQLAGIFEYDRRA